MNELKIGDKVFFELDDLTDVIDLTPGKAYEIVSETELGCPRILDDKQYPSCIFTDGLSARLDNRATWQKV